MFATTSSLSVYLSWQMFWCLWNQGKNYRWFVKKEIWTIIIWKILLTRLTARLLTSLGDWGGSVIMMYMMDLKE